MGCAAVISVPGTATHALTSTGISSAAAVYPTSSFRLRTRQHSAAPKLRGTASERISGDDIAKPSELPDPTATELCSAATLSNGTGAARCHSGRVRPSARTDTSSTDHPRCIPESSRRAAIRSTTSATADAVSRGSKSEQSWLLDDQLPKRMKRFPLARANCKNSECRAIRAGLEGMPHTGLEHAVIRQPR